MSYFEIPTFDSLTKQCVPYSGFGNTSIFSKNAPDSYVDTSQQAHSRCSEVFGIRTATPQEIIQCIDQTIASMRSQGWTPEEGSINLFTTDFGCLLTDALREMVGGSLVLRSGSDLSHASVWWAENGVEVFPFHVIYKRLQDFEASSLASFAKGVRSMLECGNS